MAEEKKDGDIAIDAVIVAVADLNNGRKCVAALSLSDGKLFRPEFNNNGWTEDDVAKISPLRKVFFKGRFKSVSGKPHSNEDFQVSSWEPQSESLDATVLAPFLKTSLSQIYGDELGSTAGGTSFILPGIDVPSLALFQGSIVSKEETYKDKTKTSCILTDSTQAQARCSITTKDAVPENPRVVVLSLARKWRPADKSDVPERCYLLAVGFF